MSPRAPRIRLTLPFGGSPKRSSTAKNKKKTSSKDSAKEEARRARLRRHARRLMLASLFAVGGYAAIFGEGGMTDLKRARQDLAELDLQVARQRAAVDRLEAQVQRLQDDPAALERIAREQLGLAAPGEIVFLLPRTDDGDLRPFAAPD